MVEPARGARMGLAPVEMAMLSVVGTAAGMATVVEGVAERTAKAETVEAKADRATVAAVKKRMVWIFVDFCGFRECLSRVFIGLRATTMQQKRVSGCAAEKNDCAEGREDSDG